MIKEEAKANEHVAAIVDFKEEGGAEAAGEAGGESKEHEIVKGGSPDDDNDASTTEEEQEHAPNSKMRVTDPDEDTYVYRDFSAIPPPTISEVGSLHPQSLQAQKLPAKLASMLADPGKLYTHAISILRKDLTAMHLNRTLVCIAATAIHAFPRPFTKELTSFILWSPHGRSWRVLNRDMFAEQALPRYFGHKNYASFVRIVNAW